MQRPEQPSPDASSTGLERVERIFQAAADLPADRREALLSRECAGDARLRVRVDALLAQYERGESLAPPSVAPAPVTEGPGTRIGRYKLLQRIGEGGFGVVYMAEQSEPVRRKVALKIIKLGMDTKEVVARFEAERQALALMDHPGIAQVLDGGETATGRPYFVMELVRGVSITEYCEHNDVSTRDRLALFARVCEAVQHAHQKGVIHRDLKPGNVMVTLHDGRPIVKVIDFGIAKAMHTPLTEKTLFTEYQRFLGTPAYMSPEQAEMSAVDIDTRTDVYALGVLLYELLTGTTPFDTRELLARGLSEIHRVIREEEPDRPSVRISTAADASLRTGQGEPRALSRLVRGDLDWIVMKALAKERTRRYGTASELAADVERHLDGLPVLAGPPGAAYRLRKFLARNRTGVVAAGLLLAALLAGIVGTTFGMLEAQRAQREEAAARGLAQRRADETTAVTEFLTATLALTDPAVALDPDVTVRELLDHAAARVGDAFAGQPDAEARVRTVIGRAYASLAENELAERHLRRASRLFESTERADQGQLYDCLWALTDVLFKLERPDGYALAQRAREVGLGHVAASHADLGAALREFSGAVLAGAWRMEGGDIGRAGALFDAARRLAEARLRSGDPLWRIVADTYVAAGLSLWYTPHDAASEPFYAEALRIQRRELPANHPDIAVTLGYLVGVMNRHGEADDAEALIRECVEMLATAFPKDSFGVAFARSKLGETLVRQRRFAEAEIELRAAHAVLTHKAQGRISFYVMDSHARLVELYEAWEDKRDAAREHRQALARAVAEYEIIASWPMAQHVFGPDDAELRAALERIQQLCGGASYQADVGSTASVDAEALGREVEVVRASMPAVDTPRAAVAARTLLTAANSLAPGAAPTVRVKMIETTVPVLGHWVEHVPLELADAQAQLASLAADQGAAVAADRHSRAAWASVRATTREDSWVTAIVKVRIARALIGQKMFAEAEALVRPAREILRAQLGVEHVDVRATDALIHAMYVEWGKPDSAREFAAGTAAGGSTAPTDR